MIMDLWFNFFELLIFYLIFLKVCAFNRTVQKVEEFLSNEAKNTKIVGAKSLEQMVQYVVQL